MRLVCFGDSFTATAGIPAEDVAAGKVPSWIDLLCERWGCEGITRGINGTGPLELLHQIQNFSEFLPGDRVFCAFSKVNRFCLSAGTPSIHHYSDLHTDTAHAQINSKSLAAKCGLRELSAADVSRIIQAHNWYELFLNNEYREYILHYAVFTALDGIAAANPQAKFYVKYCFDQEWHAYRTMKLQSKFFKLLEGDMYSICGELPESAVTNHFIRERAMDFVNYLDGAMQ